MNIRAVRLWNNGSGFMSVDFLTGYESGIMDIQAALF